MLTICPTRLKAPCIEEPCFSYLRISSYYLQTQYMVDVQYILVEVYVCSQSIFTKF